jgi:hypothetical protein
MWYSQSFGDFSLFNAVSERAMNPVQSGAGGNRRHPIRRGNQSRFSLPPGISSEARFMPDFHPRIFILPLRPPPAPNHR